MATKELLKYNNTLDDLFFWIKEYLASKLYSLNPKEEQSATFFERQLTYDILLRNSKSIDEVDTNIKLIVRGGLTGLRTYSMPLVAFFKYIANNQNEKLSSIKDIGTTFINNYVISEYKNQTNSYKRTNYNQLRSLFNKFINLNSYDEDGFQFRIGELQDGTKVALPIKSIIKKTNKVLTPKEFEQFVKSIKDYKSKRVDSYNQKLMAKFFCFGGFNTEEIKSIHKEDCHIKNILSEDYLEICVQGKGKETDKRFVYIKYDYIKEEYENSLKYNIITNYLFYTRTHYQYSSKGIYKTLQSFYVNSNIDSSKYDSHTLRKSYISLLHARGVPLDVVTLLLGRIDEDMQNIYLRSEVKHSKKVPKLFKF